MNKKVLITILTILGLTIAVGGFWYYLQLRNNADLTRNDGEERQEQNQKMDSEKKDENQNQKQEEQQNENNKESDFKKINTSNWKEYCNKEYGFCVKYPKNKYVIDEESGMIHFYYQDSTAFPGSQRKDYININISKEKNPQGVKNLYQLFKYDKNNPKVSAGRIRKEVKLKKLGSTQFIITKFYNNEIFYSILFVVMGKEDYYYRISFGGYWNVISDNNYATIMNMMKSFKRI